MPTRDFLQLDQYIEIEKRLCRIENVMDKLLEYSLRTRFLIINSMVAVMVVGIAASIIIHIKFI